MDEIRNGADDSRKVRVRAENGKDYVDAELTEEEFHKWNAIREAQSSRWLSFDHWDELQKEAAGRTKFSEYEQRKLEIKEAILDLVDHYALHVGADPKAVDVFNRIRQYARLDANAQDAKKYKAETKSFTQILTALESILEGIPAEIEKNTAEIRALGEPGADPEYAKREAALYAEAEALDNKALACMNLLSYFSILKDGGLEAPDPAGADTVFFCMKDRKQNRNADKFAKPGTAYFVDATGISISGGLLDSAKENGTDERQKIKMVDARDQPLFPHDPNMNDIAQGGLGDCWLVNAMSSLAALHPDMIRDMMKDNGDGTVTVRLFGYQGKSRELKPVYVKVDKVIPVLEDGTVHSGENCLWVNMLEQAASAIGLGSHDALRIVPPDIFEKSEALSKNTNPTQKDREDYPWLFKREDGEDKFTAFAPSFEHITGGRCGFAIDMLMGPEHSNTTQNVSEGQFTVEHSTTWRSERLFETTNDVVGAAFSGVGLHSTAGPDADFFGLMLTSDDARTERYRQFDGKTGNDKVLSFNKGNDSVTVFPFSAMQLTAITKEAKKQFDAQADKIAEQVDQTNFIDHNDEEMVAYAKDGTLRSEHLAYLMSAAANKLQGIADRYRKEYPDTIEGNREMLKKIGEEFAGLPNDEIAESLLTPEMAEEKQKNFEQEDKFIGKEAMAKCVIAATKDELVKSLRKLADLQQKVKDNYEEKVGSVFTKIQKGIRNRITLSCAVHKDDDADALPDHLPTGHAYSIVNAYVDPKTNQRYITLRNPWGEYDDNGIVYDKNGQPKLGRCRDGVFDLKFEDFFRQVDDFSYNHELDSLPDEPAAEQARENDAPAADNRRLSLGVSHSIGRTLQDTYANLMATKTWPYANTSKQFNDVIDALKATEINVSAATGLDIGAAGIGLNASLGKLRETISAYREHCRGKEGNGRHPARLGALQDLTDLLDRSITEEKAEDPRRETFGVLAEKIVRAYAAEKKITLTDEKCREEAQQLVSDRNFKSLTDKMNVFAAAKQPDKKAAELLKQLRKMNYAVKGPEKAAEPPRKEAAQLPLP